MAYRNDPNIDRRTTPKRSFPEGSFVSSIKDGSYAKVLEDFGYKDGYFQGCDMAGYVAIYNRDYYRLSYYEPKDGEFVVKPVVDDPQRFWFG